MSHYAGSSRKSQASGETEAPKEGSQDANDGLVKDDVQAKWRSGVYQFFDPDVKVLIDNKKALYQWFKCALPGGCKKAKGKQGVRRFQTKANGDPHTDRSSTSNLKKHADGCWGKDVVEGRLRGAANSSAPCEWSIFSAFARSGQRPVIVSSRVHTESEMRAHIVHWVAEANRPIKIVEDHELKELLGAGKPVAIQ
ncbi:hypothetical protein B0H14DRAFT_3739987 [Mycena olivaceomarginata]|nr:hypothetical protein B0H14DRAFT_3739987 [Mycena olivaceomarginata]